MASSKKPATPATEAAPAVKKPVAAKKAASKPESLAAAPVAKVPVKAPAKAAAKKATKPKAQPRPVVEGPAIDAAQRANYIEVAAYYIAQRRGFTPGDAQQDYLNAAAEIDQLIAAGHFSK